MDFKETSVLIFDLDYTLIDSSEGIIHCFNQARKRAGEPEVEPEKLRSRIGLPIEESFRVFDSASPPKMRDLFREIARGGAMAELSFLLPGVKETIAALRDRGYRLAVASTKSGAEIIAVLEYLGIADFFEESIGSDQVASPKPAPDSLLKVMERMGVDPGETVYIGDHVVDIQAARSAGVRVIAIRGGPCSPAEIAAEGPDQVIMNFEELRDIL